MYSIIHSRRRVRYIVASLLTRGPSVCDVGRSMVAVVEVPSRLLSHHVMSEPLRRTSGHDSGSSSRQKITSALQVIRKNAVYRSIVTRLGHAVDATTPKKCKKSSPAAAPTSSSSSLSLQSPSPADDGGFGDWRTDGLPEHSHRRPSPPCAVTRSVSDYGVVQQRSSTRKQHLSSDTKRVEEAYRRGFCDGSVADVFLMRQTGGSGVRQQQQMAAFAGGAGGGRRRQRPSSMDLADGPPWTRISSSSTVPAGLGCGGLSDKSYPTASAAVVVQHRSLPSSASRFQRHRRLSLPVSSQGCGAGSGGGGGGSGTGSSSSVDMESPSATVPTKAAAIALHQLIECYRNGYRVTDHKIALMLDILDTQQRLAKVKVTMSSDEMTICFLLPPRADEFHTLH